MLDLPDIIDAEPVGELDLVERVLIKASAPHPSSHGCGS